MAFSIAIHGAVRGEHGEPIASASFTFGAEVETCSLPLDYWGLDRYVQQWEDGLSQVCLRKSKAALITSISDPQIYPYVASWLLYPVVYDKIVYIQQHIMIPYDKLVQDHGVFKYESIPDRKTISDDGDIISEWTTNLDYLCKEMQRLKSLGSIVD